MPDSPHTAELVARLTALTNELDTHGDKDDASAVRAAITALEVADTYCGKCGGAGGYPVRSETPVQDDDAELADDLRYIAACHTKDPRDEDRIYEAADRLDALSRLSPTPDTGLIEALERISKAKMLVAWDHGPSVCYAAETRGIALTALTNAAPAQVESRPNQATKGDGQ